MIGWYTADAVMPNYQNSIPKQIPNPKSQFLPSLSFECWDLLGNCGIVELGIFTDSHINYNILRV